MTGQYMESRKEIKHDLIKVDIIERTRYIVAVHAFLSPDTIMSVHEEYYEPEFPRQDERADLDATY